MKLQVLHENVEKLVVGGAIIRDGKILLLQRPTSDTYGGLWEIPGGHVEKGESLEDATKREVEEETGLKVVSIVKQIKGFEYDNKSGGVTKQYNFLVEVEGERIRLTEHTDFQWVDLSDVESINASDEMMGVLKSLQ